MCHYDVYYDKKQTEPCIQMCIKSLSPCQNPPLLTTYKGHLRYEKLSSRHFAQMKLCDATFCSAYLCPPPLTRGGWMRGKPLGGDFSTPAASVCWSLKKDRNGGGRERMLSVKRAPCCFMFQSVLSAVRELSSVTCGSMFFSAFYILRRRVCMCVWVGLHVGSFTDGLCVIHVTWPAVCVCAQQQVACRYTSHFPLLIKHLPEEFAPVV